MGDSSLPKNRMTPWLILLINSFRRSTYIVASNISLKILKIKNTAFPLNYLKKPTNIVLLFPKKEQSLQSSTVIRQFTHIRNMAKILVIDDERAIRNTLKEILTYENYQVELAENAMQALEKAKANENDLILCDIKMPDMDGIELLPQLCEINPDTPVVMISGHGNIDTAVEAIKKGAYDFIEKPLDLNRLLITIRNALDKSSLVTETKKLRKKVDQKYTIIGQSQAIVQILEMTDKVCGREQ